MNNRAARAETRLRCTYRLKKKKKQKETEKKVKHSRNLLIEIVDEDESPARACGRGDRR